MPDRISSDHDTVRSHRVHLGQVGRTDRPQIELPERLEWPEGDVLWFSLAGTTGYAQVDTTLTGDPVVRGVFVDRNLARTGSGENRLRDWVSESGLATGDALLLDVLRTGYAYGLRAPGDRVFYEPPEPPASSLADIARDLDQ